MRLAVALACLLGCEPAPRVQGCLLLVGWCGPLDSGPIIDHIGPICDPVRQMGCVPGQNCEWVDDAVTPERLGHIDCVPVGNVAIGGACTTGPPGPMGYDNCAKGAFCVHGTCETICDPSKPCSYAQACVTHDCIFADCGQPPIAGTCEIDCAVPSNADVPVCRYVSRGVPAHP